MATKIRLQRHGKKNYAFYHIVAADSRAPRDGKFIEKIGTYNPNTNPASIDIDFERALYWVKVGAEMTDTARAILSYKGVLYKNHLINGVKKGALTEDEVEKKFEAWLSEKDQKISKKTEGLEASKSKAMAERLASEKGVSEARAKEIAAKNTPEPEVVEETTTPEEGATEEATTEAPAEDAKEEATAEPVAEETPVAETPAEEAPKEEGKKADEE